MSLFITSLNSGSNGNCYYIGNEREAILVDAGISCREIEKRLLRLELSVKKIKAIFISHEHSDHIRGVQVLARKYQLPVYITQRTLISGRLQIEETLVNEFKAYQNVTIGQLTITPFPKFHDASDPHSFIVSGNGVNIGVLTDIGSVCKHVIDNFKLCHAVFLEANYDEKMLEEGDYPFYLKGRIRGGHGHLSNHQALELFTKHKANYLSHVLLSHLSKENNSPQLAEQLFQQHAGNTRVVVASRDSETEVFIIKANGKTEMPDKKIVVNEKRETLHLNKQISLF
ncbi:MBL fold metallo-hydrolase [Aurantibacillus circumpalustris]|uniref:MBL fold metallo-hydrolase n=1 Tax=Aurantibacillus circumpalustris TaxID=3036359 RepID=UPI00295AC0A8|nr:MBL fold metallo-hydrolase [Aurantibacillus circumpalustris]